jgi:hypothetical protein
MSILLIHEHGRHHFLVFSSVSFFKVL